MSVSHWCWHLLISFLFHLIYFWFFIWQMIFLLKPGHFYIVMKLQNFLFNWLFLTLFCQVNRAHHFPGFPLSLQREVSSLGGSGSSASACILVWSHVWGGLITGLWWSPDYPQSFLWQHRSRQREEYLITAWWGWKSRLSMWSPWTPGRGLKTAQYGWESWLPT